MRKYMATRLIGEIVSGQTERRFITENLCWFPLSGRRRNTLAAGFLLPRSRRGRGRLRYTLLFPLGHGNSTVTNFAGCLLMFVSVWV